MKKSKKINHQKFSENLANSKFSGVFIPRCHCGKIAEVKFRQEKAGFLYFCKAHAEDYSKTEFQKFTGEIPVGSVGPELKLRNDSELFQSSSIAQVHLPQSFYRFGKEKKYSRTHQNYFIISEMIKFSVEILIENTPDFWSLAQQEKTKNGDNVLSVEYYHWNDQSKEVKYVFSVLKNLLWIEYNNDIFYV